MAREPFNRTWAEEPEVDQFGEPTDAMWRLGWEGGADKDPPEAYAQNYWQNRVDFALQQIERQGAMDWHAEAIYSENGLAVTATGDIYASQTSDNTGNDPATDGGVNWFKFVFGRASEAVAGFIGIATQAQVDAGTDDTTAVTPKKLRWGVSYSIGSAGYVVLPSWLGGFIIQWGSTGSLLAGTSVLITHNISYPNGSIAQWAQAQVVQNGTTPLCFVTDPAPGGNQFTVRNRSSVDSGNSLWFSIGH